MHIYKYICTYVNELVSYKYVHSLYINFFTNWLLIASLFKWYKIILQCLMSVYKQFHFNTDSLLKKIK